MNRPISPHEQIDMLREENRQLREYIARLERGDDVSRAIRIFKLSKPQAVAFSMLLNRDVDRWDILSATHSRDRRGKSDSPEEWSVNAIIKRMRKRLRPVGIDIESVYGFGYRMTEENRSRARKLLEAA